MAKLRTACSVAVGCCLLLLVALWWNAAPVLAGPNVQITSTPRPVLTPTVGPPPASQPPGGGEGAHAPRLHGAVLDWGQGNMPAGVKVILRNGNWEIPIETDDGGEYRFRDIGDEIAFLNALVPNDRGDLRPLTAELPVKVQVDRELIVNMAFHPEGVVPETILGIEMSVSSPSAQPGETVSYAIDVSNRWDRGINQVIAADYLPQGLTFVSATTSQGEVVYDRGLVWATLGSLGAGDSATVSIEAKVDANTAPGTQILNWAAAYHSENVAVQAQAPIQVTGDAAQPPAAASETPQPPEAKSETNHLLPETGISFLLPVAGVLLAGLLFGIRKLRQRGP